MQICQTFLFNQLDIFPILYNEMAIFSDQLDNLSNLTIELAILLDLPDILSNF